MRFVIADRFSEHRMQFLWSRIKKGTRLFDTLNREIEVTFPGLWNSEEGPDFRNAVININGARIIGDIELHINERDWISHNHQNNPEYSNVILHIVKNRSKDVSSLNIGLSTVVFNFDDHTKYDMVGARKLSIGKCAGFFGKLNDRELSNIFHEAGIQRFKEKTNLMKDDIINKGADEVFLSRTFECLGFKKNKTQFRELGSKLSKYNFCENDNAAIQAVVWGLSGFLDTKFDQTSLTTEMADFISMRKDLWHELKNHNKSAIKWNKSGARPYNTIYRRIQAGAILAAKFGVVNPFKVFLALLLSSDTWKVGFEETFSVSDPLWESHSSFEHRLNKKAVLIGPSRKIDIIINSCLPVIYAYSLLTKDKAMADYSFSYYCELKAGQYNSIYKKVSELWFENPNRLKRIMKTSCIQQGVIYLYKNYCSYSNLDCDVCEIYRNTSNNQT